MEALLTELESLLYGYNYQVFLRAYRVPFASGQPAECHRFDLTAALAEIDERLRSMQD